MQRLTHKTQMARHRAKTRKEFGLRPVAPAGPRTALLADLQPHRAVLRRPSSGWNGLQHGDIGVSFR